MAKWEYQTIVRSRGWSYAARDKDFLEASDWNIDMEKALPELGDDGWELVAVSSRSSALGGLGQIQGRAEASFRDIEGSVPDYAGFTTEELWVFKRPKQ